MLLTGYMPDESGLAGFPVALFSFSPVPKYSFCEEMNQKTGVGRRTRMKDSRKLSRLRKYPTSK